MFEFITGKIVELNPTFVVIENQGIGYYINISLNCYKSLQLNSQTIIFIHQVIREDANLLFGFTDKEERNLFRLLISVSGIGANTARLILSSLSAEEVEMAIIQENINQLKSIKGIGIKTAQRIILELKDKISKKSTGTEIFYHIDNKIREEALFALLTLGFPKNTIEKTIDKILSETKSITVEDLIKQALKIL
jgi:Holliday junction DNA helicase RuvA